MEPEDDRYEYHTSASGRRRRGKLKQRRTWTEWFRASGKRLMVPIGMMVLIVVAFMMDFTTFFRADYYLEHSSPDRVAGAHFIEGIGSDLVVLHDMITVRGERYSSTGRRRTGMVEIPRMEIFDLESGRCLARFDAGYARMLYVGCDGWHIWLLAMDDSLGLHARNPRTGEVIIDQEELFGRNAMRVGGTLEYPLFDRRAQRLAIRTSDNNTYRIDPVTFGASRVSAEEIPFLSYLVGDSTTPAYPAIILPDSSRFNLQRVVDSRSSTPVSRAHMRFEWLSRGDTAWHRSDLLFDGGRFLYDATANGDMPIPIDSLDALIVHHYGSADEDATSALTAIGRDGTRLWTLGSDELEEMTIRAAHMRREELVLVTDKEILMVDPQRGRVKRRISLQTRRYTFRHPATRRSSLSFSGRFRPMQWCATPSAAMGAWVSPPLHRSPKECSAP